MADTQPVLSTRHPVRSGRIQNAQVTRTETIGSRISVLGQDADLTVDKGRQLRDERVQSGGEDCGGDDVGPKWRRCQNGPPRSSRKLSTLFKRGNGMRQDSGRVNVSTSRATFSRRNGPMLSMM